MKSKILLLAILGLLLSQYIYAQSQKEYYFKFPVHSREEISKITKQVSIDNYRNDTVWAYANPVEFVKFANAGYDITLLPHPGYNPDVVMGDYIPSAPTTVWNFYPTYSAYESYMTGFQTSYPAICQTQTIATLASGRKLMVVKISDNVATDENEPEFLYTSSIHGDETTGYVLMLHLIEYLLSNYGTNAEVTELVNNVEIYINPLANPDGTYAGGNNTVNGATRSNANGVDMNRNYPDPQDGDHPDGNAWQAETIAFMDFATQHDFVLSANFHGGAEVVNYPWDTWATLSADDNWWIYVSAEYADTAQIHAPSGYMTDVTASGYTNGFAWYEVNGGRQDYMNYFQRCREVTIELSSTKLVPASTLLSYWDYNWRSLILYMKEVRYGIHGTITSQATGLPVAAKVFISGHDINNSDVYSSATFGDYHRPIKAGTYTLTISAPCFQTQTIPNVVVTDHATTTLNIQMVSSAGVTTTAASSITMTSATSGGNVICDGGSSITARGVCWSTSANPTISNSHTTDGSGMGSYTSLITGLSANTLYHVRAYATNAGGTVYGDDLTFNTACGTISSFPWNEGFENAGAIPNCWTQEYVTTPGLNWLFITGNGGSYPSTAHGGTYNACLKDATAADNKTKLVSPPLNLSGMTGTTLTFYHYMRVWGSDQDQLLVYYKTSAAGTWTLLTSYTTNVTSWTLRTISLPNPSGEYYIAFEGNAKYGYGVCIDDVSVTGTLSVPAVTTTTPTSITSTTASSGGNVTSQGGSAVTARGVCWSTAANPTITDSHTSDGTGTGAFTSSITGLTPGTLYHVRAYATNTSGTAYGSDLQFSTIAVAPTVSTTTPTSITGTSAVSGGNVSSDGGSAVTARGVCWSTSSNPVVTDSHTTDGSGTGTFTSNMTGLTPATLYHLRAYATNSIGTSYGTDLQFTTGAAPTLSVTPSNQNVSSSTGSTSFTVTSNSSWSAISDQGWCSVTPSGNGNGTISANFSENALLTSRIANITVTVAGLTPVVVTVTQAGAAPTLGVAPSNQNVTNAAGSTSFNVTSNSSWTALSDQGWCSITPSGSGNGIITANYTENLSINPRVANVTVTVAGLTPVTVTVSQAGYSPTLSVTPANQNVSAPAGNTTFTVVSNSNWLASSDQSWCSVTTSGSGNGIITAIYSENLNAIQRVAIITVSVSGLTPVIVTITQAATALVDFHYTVENFQQTSDNAFEFDLMLLDMSVGTPFELATVQAGITLSPTIFNGGSVSAMIVPGTSTLNASQQPTSVTFTQSANCIKLAAKAPPGAGGGSIISTDPLNPTRICRIRLTNTAAWTTASYPALTFCFTTVPYPTKMSQYISGVNTALTLNSTNTYVNVAYQMVLNPPPSIAVDPPNHTVTASSGSVTFSLQCNAGWTLSSNQSWCAVSPLSGFGNATITATYEANTTATQRVASLTFLVNGLAPTVVTVTQEGIVNKTVNLFVLLEGLYSGSGMMNPAMDESGAHWGSLIADKISVELHDASNYSNLIQTFSNIELNTNGTATFIVPSGYSGSYYLAIRHRNSIETVTATPVSFAGSTISYSFDAASKAFGSNLMPKSGGYWVIFAGDVNQDGLIDSGDMIPVDNDAATFATGYLATDVNGDGLIDSGDMIILDNNGSAFISTIVP
jgi:hypothetical protein